MTSHISRRSALKSLAGTAAALSAASQLEAFAQDAKTVLKGNIHHSVCKWCYKMSLEDLCKLCKELGIASIDLLGPADWPMLKKYGLHCAMTSNVVVGEKKAGTIENGWNRPENHDPLVEAHIQRIGEVADAGFDTLITFSGNRAPDISDEKGLENCANGLKRIMKAAEEKKVTIVMELLNSKVNHKNYMCDHTAWGVELCKRVGSDRFKLLYDIYHMQIMEGDVIRTLTEATPFIAHYHTGGVPGRHEIDETQELFYPAIMHAIIKTGFKGYVAQEFIPTRTEADSLRQSIGICDV
jgi:hydroxypyruvate isomerase